MTIAAHTEPATVIASVQLAGGLFRRARLKHVDVVQ
jgi:hypothetical protein